MDCGANAHVHVRVCARNGNGGNLFSPRGQSAQRVFLESHCAACQLRITQYLGNVGDAGVRQKVLFLVEGSMKE